MRNPHGGRGRSTKAVGETDCERNVLAALTAGGREMTAADLARAIPGSVTRARYIGRVCRQLAEAGLLSKRDGVVVTAWGGKPHNQKVVYWSVTEAGRAYHADR